MRIPVFAFPVAKRGGDKLLHERKSRFMLSGAAGNGSALSGVFDPFLLRTPTQDVRARLRFCGVFPPISTIVVATHCC